MKPEEVIDQGDQYLPPAGSVVRAIRRDQERGRLPSADLALSDSFDNCALLDSTHRRIDTPRGMVGRRHDNFDRRRASAGCREPDPRPCAAVESDQPAHLLKHSSGSLWGICLLPRRVSLNLGLGSRRANLDSEEGVCDRCGHSSRRNVSAEFLCDETSRERQRPSGSTPSRYAPGRRVRR